MTLGLLLGGLLLMHGLSVHGAHSAMPTATETMSEVAAVPGEVVAMPAHEHGSMEILCLAVLPLGLLLLLRRTTADPVRRRAAGHAAGPIRALTGRTPDPPTPLLLSISR